MVNECEWVEPLDYLPMYLRQATDDNNGFRAYYIGMAAACGCEVSNTADMFVAQLPLFWEIT